MNRELNSVDLVDSCGNSIGVTNVAAAHEPPGRLHRAVSVVVVDPDERLLLQRRASSKTRFADRWANTCCGHPPPGANPRQFARRRLLEEIGLELADLSPVGTFVYRATDELSGFVEHEYDHAYLGRVEPRAALRLDPAEVAEWRWVSPLRLRHALNSTTSGNQYVPWLRQLLVLARAI